MTHLRAGAVLAGSGCCGLQRCSDTDNLDSSAAKRAPNVTFADLVLSAFGLAGLFS